MLTPGIIRAFENVERSIGGRDALVSTLLTHTLAAEELYLVGLLADPSNTGKSLAVVCAQGGIGLGQVFALFKDATKARALVEATVEIAAQLPAVAKGVMEDAVSGEKPCQKCRGSGWVTPNPTESTPNPTPAVCTPCQGTGTRYYEPEPRIRELALTMGGLIEKHPQVTINQTKNAIGIVAPGAYDTLVSGLDDLLYGDPRSRVIDVAPLEAAEEGDHGRQAPVLSEPDGAGAAGWDDPGSGPNRLGVSPDPDDAAPGRPSAVDGTGTPAETAGGRPPRLLRPLS